MALTSENLGSHKPKAEKEKERVIGYIDGFNLYYGIKSKGWKSLYWLNVHALMNELLLETQQLVSVKYFTSRIRSRKRRENVKIPISKPCLLYLMSRCFLGNLSIKITNVRIAPWSVRFLPKK